MSTYTPTGEQLDRASKTLVEMLALLADTGSQSQGRTDARIVTLSVVRTCLDEAADATDPVVAARMVARARAQILALDKWLADKP